MTMIPENMNEKPAFVAIRKDTFDAIGGRKEGLPYTSGRDFFHLVSTSAAAHTRNLELLGIAKLLMTNSSKNYCVHLITAGYKSPDISAEGDRCVAMTDVPALVLSPLTLNGAITIRYASSGEDLAKQLHSLAKHEAAMRPAVGGTSANPQPSPL